MSDDEFVNQLESCVLPESHFHHADHLRAAWLYLNRFPAPQAIERFSEVLRRYVKSLGKADRYHETITWAYLLLVNERIRRAESNGTWQQFAELRSDLFDWNNPILLKYYRPETLNSQLARRIFLMPDRL